jgi:hypothetical protein
MVAQLLNGAHRRLVMIEIEASPARKQYSEHTIVDVADILEVRHELRVLDGRIAAFERLGRSVAALGAELRLHQEGLEGDPRVRPLLHDIVSAVDPQLLDGIDPIASRDIRKVSLIGPRRKSLTCRVDGDARWLGTNDLPSVGLLALSFERCS